MSDVAAAAGTIKLPKSCRIGGSRRAYESGCQAGGRDNHILYHQAEKKPLLGADEELPALDNL
jgi:hypothetical protein